MDNKSIKHKACTKIHISFMKMLHIIFLPNVYFPIVYVLLSYYILGVKVQGEISFKRLVISDIVGDNEYEVCTDN